MSSSNYVKDEKVLCFHHEILYDAKIMEVRHQDEKKNGPLEFLVHYKGWKNTWDDWVFEDRLRKINEENRELQTIIRRDAEASLRQRNAKPNKNKRTLSDRGSVRDSEERGSSVPGRGNKRAKGDSELEKEEAFHARPSIRIPMPDNLKAYIVDDWEHVTKNNCVVKLPAENTVRMIFQDYRDEEAPKRSGYRLDVDILDEIIAGMLEYFDVMLDTILLYRIERPQYRILREKFKPLRPKQGPIDVYGAEHLIRLFSLLPELLAQTNMDLRGTQRTRDELAKFALWLSKNSEKYFRTEYIPVEESYADDPEARFPKNATKTKSPKATKASK
ncbi:Chromatin modification-related protein eaf3 [Penicillium argentinense]|uniref:Chromatin modification-related protein EAF3 n=1 Tax=Penicillium argentinense TaxID=1131581 RepID=A0A9W9FLV7_9EURO|nr:Chromatin modification-related protein eaf3 [Penicillium argentinense]KAJ5102595.1 Chromatin modification-related protein eaf3 [Penicillium argentinense]